VYRATDFRSNEFRGLRGGETYEPVEHNPMIGYRGCYRYIKEPDLSPWSCRRWPRVREQSPSVHIMIPFVRTRWELEECLSLIDASPLGHQRGLHRWVMAEVPSVMHWLPEYIGMGIDGVSIGSNDLTQLVRGVDRDSDICAELFDESDPAVLDAIGQIIGTARKSGSPPRCAARRHPPNRRSPNIWSGWASPRYRSTRTRSRRPGAPSPPQNDGCCWNLHWRKGSLVNDERRVPPRRTVMSISMATELGTDLLGGPETALRHACTRVPMGAPADSVSETLDVMRGKHFESAVAVAVLDHDKLVGVAAIERMLAAPAGATLRDVMDPDPPVVAPNTDQEQAAWQAVHRNETGLAVVDADGRFCGLIAPQQLLSVLLQEHDEDMARLGGFLHSVESAQATSVESIGRRLWHRMPWLVLGLIGAMVSAVLMSTFEAQLNANLAVAYFVPGIVYLADAVGTQTETLAIRGLSVGVGIRSITGREALTGLSVGVLLGVVMLPVVALMTGDVMLAAAVALAVLAASTIATIVALALPWLLQRMGKDPAFGSGPLATVIQDLLSIVIYLAAVATLLG
jgi:magnesium transporter